jgi:hypothetical protein
MAHTPADPAAVKDLSKLASAASLVAQTQVTKVVYKMSAPGANGSRGIPYTFVTFKISSVLQGSSPGSSLTLRFVGGSDGQGGFLDVEGVPAFEVGDTDVLFVANNGGGTGCALVQCEFGRFRVDGGAVYGAHGEAVLSVAGGKVEFGSGYGPASLQTFSYPAPSFDDMMKNPAFAASVGSSGMPLSAARTRYNSQAPKNIVVTMQDSAGVNGALQANAQAAAPISVQQFVSSVSTVASASSGQFAAIQSANVSAPLTVPPGTAASAPASGGASVSPGPVIKKN